MLLPTQDDSLVFANETRWPDNRFSEPDLANTSEIFGSPHAPNEPTQVDLPENALPNLEDESTPENSTHLTLQLQDPRLHEHSTSSPGTELNDTIADKTESPNTVKRLPENGHVSSVALGSGQHMEVTGKLSLFSPGQDTQIIKKDFINIESNFTPNDIGLAPNLLDDSGIDTQESLEAKRSKALTPVLGENNLKDTQIIRPEISSKFSPLEPENLPTQADGTSSPGFTGANDDALQKTQIMQRFSDRDSMDTIHDLNLLDLNNFPQRSSIQQARAPISSSSHDNKLSYPQLDDTQIIERDKNFQSGHKTSSFEDLSLLDEHQNDSERATTEEQSLKADFKKAAEFSSPCKFDSSILHALGNSDMGRKIEASSEKNTEVTTALGDNSIIEDDYNLEDDRRDEATTQVLNTQEELYDESSLKLVDLGNKSIYSSDQTNTNRHVSQYSVASEDENDNSEVEDVTFVYEDSIFNQKKRKLDGRVPKRLDVEEAPLELVIMNSSLQLPSTAEIISSEPTNNAATQTAESQTNSLNVALHDKLIIGKDLSTIISSQVALKESWSSESSELEDISRDASINMPFEESFTAEGLSQEVRISSRRRNNAVPDELTQSQEVLREESLSVLTIESIVHGLAVWAFTLFRNFPAVVLDAGEESSLVLEHNGKESAVRNSDLHVLDIRVGDFVLVTLKFAPYVVVGLYHFSEKSQFKCVRGFDTVIIARKGKHSVAQGKELHVPLQDICMEADQWASHQLRFQFIAGELDLLLAAYSTVHRVILEQMKENESLKDTTHETASSEKLLTRPSTSKSGLFSGMFFFVTSIEGDRKDHLQKLVTGNGGVLIDDEIDSLLQRSIAENGNCSLKLNCLKDFKFGALLSDGFSRSAKYLQALALGWPLLADVYVEKALEDPSMLDLWPSFLLPAGVSFYFNGTKSHDIFQFRNNYMNNLDMSNQLANNAALLSSKTILILCHNQDKKVLNMCGFIFHAFGAKTIHSFENCSAIENYIRAHGSESTLIYDNNDLEFQKLHEKRSKRKPFKKRYKVGVVGWEWVVQCVISNLIWKPSQEVQI